MTFGEVHFPPAPIIKLPVLDDPMAVFEGVVRIKVEITPTSIVKANEIVLQGKVRYQACDDISCFPPVQQAFNVKIPFGNSVQSLSASSEVSVDLKELESEPTINPSKVMAIRLCIASTCNTRLPRRPCGRLFGAE